MLTSASAGWDAFCGFGIGLLRSTATQLHIGMVYRTGASNLFCDLAWHYRLRNEPADAMQGLHWANSGLDEINREVMRDWVRKLATNIQGLPYGFNVNGDAFDRQTGSALPLPLGEGMTCASFILAAHRHRGIELLDTLRWPSRADDTAWQQYIIDQLHEHTARTGRDIQAHLDALQGDIGSLRYRPEEVAAGAISRDTPLSFEDTRRLADEIVASLQ